jgi:hypothetical protein
LLGPSGVGKTTFGDWLGANRRFRYLHIDIDGGGKTDVLTAEGLKESWGKLERGDPAPVARKLQDRAKAKGEQDCVLTFPSVTFFGPWWIDHLAKHNIGVRYLYGPKELCIEEYVLREPDRDRAFWSTNNEENYKKIGAPELTPYRADIIKPSGERLSCEEIAELLKIE